jgi:fumarate reductase subunit C
MYRQPVPVLWWVRRWSYLVFVLRELSSVFVAWFVVFLLIGVHAVGAGSQEYTRFLDFAAHPAVLTLNVVALAFVLLHAITWFGLAPKAMVLRVRGMRVPAAVVLAAHYLLWAAVTAGIAWVLLR